MKGGLKSRPAPRGQFQTVVFEDTMGFKTLSLMLGPKKSPKIVIISPLFWVAKELLF